MYQFVIVDFYLLLMRYMLCMLRYLDRRLKHKTNSNEVKENRTRWRYNGDIIISSNSKNSRDYIQ